MYERYIKRLLDIVLSLLGMLVLLLPMAVFALITVLDSPGPVFFLQKRVGIHKTYFNIIKLRSMPVRAPHDVPTHQLANAEAMLTPWQRWIRRSSIDELPQILCIFLGQMSVVGPRPALWNQYDLITERDKYGANDVRPGLTGWAQINGRDELEIPEKARLDGEYVRRLSFGFDLRCLIGTVFSVVRHEGVVEGGTGALKR